MARSIKLVGTNVSGQRSFVPVNENDAAIEFAGVVVPFSTGELAKAAKRSKEAAKAWKEGRSLPSAWSLLNMAQSIRPVREWMLAKLGSAPEFPSPEVMHAMMGALYQVAHQQGPDGDAVRKILVTANIGTKK